MKKQDLGFWIILAVMCLAGLLSWRMYLKVYQRTHPWSIHDFPRVIGDWTAEEIPISDDDKAMLETDNVFVRRYTNPKNEEVYLFAVYSQDNRKVSHPPEICYQGAGAAILNSAPDSIETSVNGGKLSVNRLTIEKGNVRQIFVYWFKVGDTFTPSYWKQQVLIAYKSLLGLPASSALIRVSATVLHEEEEPTIRVIKNFSRLIIPLLHTHLP